MINTALKLVTAQTSWAVSLAEAKSQLRVDSTDENTLIQDLIYVAQRQIEEFCNLDLTAATYDFFLTDFPVNGIVLPKSPVASVTSIKYYDSSNVLQTWNSSNYFYSANENPTLIRWVDNVSIPSINSNRFDAIQVRFATGFTSPEVLPKTIKQAVLIALTDLYNARGNTPRTQFSNWHALVYPHRVWHSTVENTK